MIQIDDLHLVVLDKLFWVVVGLFANKLHDRLLWESLQLEVEFSMSVSNEDGYSYNIQVMNLGRKAIPPYQVAIWHQDAGSFYLFSKQNTTERLPHQKEVHSFNPGRKDARIIQALYRRFRELEINKWKFRLVLDHSDNYVIFNNANVGVGLVECLRDILAGHQHPHARHWSRVYANNSYAARFHAICEAVKSIICSDGCRCFLLH